MNESLTYQNFESGIEDFEKLINQKLVYVDKTSYLEDLLHRAAVTLLLRPRRFGKTLSMSMLSCFLEINYLHPEDRCRPERLFKDLAIHKNKAFCDKYMGRFPVISISLKSIQHSNFVGAMKSMMELLGAMFKKYAFLSASDKQDPSYVAALIRRKDICLNESLNLRDTVNMDTAIAIAKSSLKLLSEMLYAEYGRETVIIIDEYDVPLLKAKVNGYYTEMLDVIKEMLGNALKTNNSLAKGFVTGCLRIAHQSIFTDINNFVCLGSSNDTQFAEFIGFTKDETASLLSQCGMESRLPDVVAWYDGYSFAGNDMLCPWSVLNFLYDALSPKNDRAVFKPQNYWANSSGNDIIEICMKHPGEKDAERLQNLLNMGTEYVHLCEFTSYPEITSATDFDTFATLMVHTGYLTVAEDSRSEAPRTESAVQDPDETPDLVPVKIPNREVCDCFSRKAKLLFSGKNPEWTDRAVKMLDALFAGDAEQVQNIITDMLMSFISIRDASVEAYYHGFMTSVLGIAAGTAGKGNNQINTIKMESQEDSGNGFSDIILSKTFEGKAVILEFKKCKTGTPKAFRNMCQEALKQIEKKKYEYRYRASGYQEIIKYGIAFYGKGCLVIKKTDEPVSE